MEQDYAITGMTKTLALIGSPVDHSMSPAMHNASFKQLGLDYVYVVFDVQPEELGAVMPAMKAMGFAGGNVTMPCKTYVLEYLDEISDAARLMGAVNTIKFEDGKAYGYNTDGMGFMRNLQEHGVDVLGGKFTLVGAGGAGSAIYTQAALDGVAEIDVFNVRDNFFDATAERIRKVSEKTGCKVRLHDLADTAQLGRSVAESDLFVNATRVGMAPLEDRSTLPEEFLHTGLVVADTVYSPRETKLLGMAAKHGNKTLPGVGMLLWQAAVGEEIYADAHMPVEYIEQRFFAA